MPVFVISVEADDPAGIVVSGGRVVMMPTRVPTELLWLLPGLEKALRFETAPLAVPTLPPDAGPRRAMG